MLLNNAWVNNEIKEEIKRYLEANENEKTKIQHLWDTGKALFRGKFIALQAYLKKQEKAQINNVTLHLKELEKEKQTKCNVSKRKEIIKISESINEIESKNWYRRLMNPRAGSLKNKKDWQNFYQDDQEKKGRHK